MRFAEISIFWQSNPADEVVILSGDHIYHMDFDAMIEYHRSKKADVTVGMMVVPKSEMYQFGCGIVDQHDRIVEWEEKPKTPRSNLASMGIYVFDYKYLLNTLILDKAEVDFGMHILPRAIAEDNVFAYPFYGYWRDVGTIQAYWEANMDVSKEREWHLSAKMADPDQYRDGGSDGRSCSGTLWGDMSTEKLHGLSRQQYPGLGDQLGAGSRSGCRGRRNS